MNRSQGRSSREAVPGHRGVSNIPISGKGVDVEARFTGSHLKDEDVEDGEWEEYDKSKHEPLLLPDLRNLNVSDENIEHEQEAISVDPYTIEGLDKAKSLVNDFFREVNDWRMETGRDSLSPAQEDLYKGIRSHFSYLNGLIRSQKDLVEVDALELDEYGESLVANINLLIKMKESLLDAEVEHPESEIEQNKTGWWDKEFQKEQGISEVAGAAAVQRWGDQDGPIGFEPLQTESEEDKVRTGWWQDGYRNEQGYSETPIAEGKYIQRGALGVPNDAGSLEPDKLVSRPVPGRKGQVQWSLRGPEASNEKYGQEEIEHYDYKYRQVQVAFQAISAKRNLENLSETDKLDFEFFEKTYDRFLDLIDEAEEEVEKNGEIGVDTKKELDFFYGQLVKGVEHYENLIANGDPLFIAQLDNADVDSPEPVPVDDEPQVATSEEEVLAAPVNPAYEQAREAWREAKKLHDLSQEKSRKQTEEYYGKWWNKARSTVGFSPDLPPEILALKKEATAATAVYHKASQELLAAQSLDASPETKKKLERHGRMIAYSLLLRNESELIEAQQQGLVMKDSAAFDFIKKHGKKLRIAGAATVGAATGGLLVGAWAAGRVLAGAAVTGAATGFVGKKLDARVEAKQIEYSEKYKEEVESIIATIQSKQEKRETFSADELLDIQSKLSSLYAVVDKATKDRIRGVLATGFATSVLFGLGASELADAVAGAPEVSANTDVPKAAPLAADASAHSAGVGESAAPGAVPATPPESVPPGASEAAPPAPYVAEKGDNFWNIMEGQTDAGKPAYLDHVDASHKQELIDLVRDRIEEDPAVLKELGFGETADDLNLGAEVDTTRLNEIAEVIAKEKGWHIEAAPDVAETPPAPETPTAGADQTKVLDTKAAPEAAVVTNVSPDKINDFARSYPKGLYPTGFQNFNHDFQTLWVDRVQGPPSASGGFLGIFFSNAPNSDSAYNEFDSYEIGDFKKLATVDASVLASRLADKNIDMADYLAWKDEIAKWEKEGLVIDPKDRFSDVAEAAFINSLEKAKAV